MKKIHLFEIVETEIISSPGPGNTIIHKFSHSPKHFKSYTTEKVSFVNLMEFCAVLRMEDGSLHPNSPHLIPAETQSALKLKTFVDNDTGLEYLVSAPLVQVSNEALAFLLKMQVVSLLRIFKPKQNYPYDFKTQFIGWNLIVYPFICFLLGLAKIPGMNIYARMVHLIQSSGFGKTRICFEVLKFNGSGIYCVYRPANYDTGYPKTTPWLKQLVHQFLKSESDEDSVEICLSFIYWAMQTFSTLEDGHFKYFAGDLNWAELSNFVDTDNTTVQNIINFPTEKPFIIVMDECQELLITPDGHPELISLYRAFKRALKEIVNSSVVVVFLGTKSSLGDFVLSGLNKSSARYEIAKPGEVFDVPVYIFTHSCNSMLTKRYKVSYETVATFKMVDEVKLPRSWTLQAIAWDCGRPLWRQYDTFSTAFDVGRIKLAADEDLKELAALILRTGSSVTPQDKLAHRLVLSSMATLMYVDVDGSRCYIEYVPEPILSNNARLLLNHRSSYVKSLKDYVKGMELGVFHESGEAGEQVARIVLLRIMDLVCLYPKQNGLSLQQRQSVHGITAENLFGPREDILNCVETLTEILDAIHSVNDEITSTTTESPVASNQPTVNLQPELDKGLVFVSPNIATTTVRQFLLLASNGFLFGQFEKFGVSDAVLDGFISVNQFVKLQASMRIDQVYLMQAFSRGCGLILAARAVGADLIFPVLRKDNRMSCIAIQVKNLQVRTFPSEGDVSAHFSHSKLQYLDFGVVGDFAAAPVDDFIRMAIQFGPEFQSKDKIYSWTAIPNSRSNCPPATSASSRRPVHHPCNVFWLRGLQALKHCFFCDEDILGLLNGILSGRRDYYCHLDYPQFPLPTFMQSTEEDARMLGRLARPLANYANLVPFEQQARPVDSEFGGSYEDIKLKERMKLLQMSPESFNHFSRCTISPRVAEVDQSILKQSTKTVTDTIVASLPAVLSPEERAILDQIVVNSGSLANLSKYQTDFNRYKTGIKAIDSNFGKSENWEADFREAMATRIAAQQEQRESRNESDSE